MAFNWKAIGRTRAYNAWSTVILCPKMIDTIVEKYFCRLIFVAFLTINCNAQILCPHAAGHAQVDL